MLPARGPLVAVGVGAVGGTGIICPILLDSQSSIIGVIRSWGPAIPVNGSFRAARDLLRGMTPEGNDTFLWHEQMLIWFISFWWSHILLHLSSSSNIICNVCLTQKWSWEGDKTNIKSGQINESTTHVERGKKQAMWCFHDVTRAWCHCSEDRRSTSTVHAGGGEVKSWAVRKRKRTTMIYWWLNLS